VIWPLNLIEEDEGMGFVIATVLGVEVFVLVIGSDDLHSFRLYPLTP